jgi:plastocyanin domain-containing protein
MWRILVTIIALAIVGFIYLWILSSRAEKWAEKNKDH